MLPARRKALSASSSSDRLLSESADLEVLEFAEGNILQMTVTVGGRLSKRLCWLGLFHGSAPPNRNDSTRSRQRKCLARSSMTESSRWADNFIRFSSDARLRYFVNHAVISFLYYLDMNAATLERIVAETFYDLINAIAAGVTQIPPKYINFLRQTIILGYYSSSLLLFFCPCSC